MEKHAFDPACCLGERLQTLSRAELTALAETICRILTERGAYHGGIRPDNISRAGDGTVGLGAPARTDTKDWTTEELEFMAPEVFWSGSLDASADVYSLGLLLYAGVMGGRLPFYPDDRAPQPEDMAAALRRRMNGEALPLARKAGRDLAQIIARATQCRPADRYATPAELCAALEQYDAEQRRNVPTAQEMFNKPEQELSEVERMMLSILAEEAAAPVPEAEPEEKTEPEAEEETESGQESEGQEETSQETKPSGSGTHSGSLKLNPELLNKAREGSGAYAVKKEELFSGAEGVSLTLNDVYKCMSQYGMQVQWILEESTYELGMGDMVIWVFPGQSLAGDGVVVKDAEEYRESLRNKTLPEGTTFAVQFDARATGTNETVDIEKIREINGQ